MEEGHALSKSREYRHANSIPPPTVHLQEPFPGLGSCPWKGDQMNQITFLNSTGFWILISRVGNELRLWVDNGPQTAGPSSTEHRRRTNGGITAGAPR